MYKGAFDEKLAKDKFLEKAPISTHIEADHLNEYKEYNHIGLSKGGAKYADGVIIGSEDLEKELGKYAKSLGIPVLEYAKESYLEKYAAFYNELYQ